MPSRDATTHWQGDLQTGSGTVTLDSSNAGQFPVSFPTRAGEPDGQTSPEELIAAAHSACYAMSLSNGLTQAGHPPTTLDVSAEVTLGRDDSGLLITTMFLLRSVQYGFFGPLNPDHVGVKDADWWELVAFLTLAAAALLFGVFPAALTSTVLPILPALIGGAP